MKKLIKENKEIIIFWVILAIVLFVWCEHVEKTNDKITNIKNNIIEKENR